MVLWAKNAPVSARTRLGDIIDFQADGCARGGSRLYSYLLRRIADDVSVGGVFGPLLLGFGHDRFGSAPLSQLMASVHRIVLEGRAPGLACFYDSVGGWFDDDQDSITPGTSAAHGGAALWAAFVETALANEEEIAAHLYRPDQTNHVGRSVAMLPGFLRINELCPAPMRLFEVGASAGLNLRWDRYRYETPQWSFGPPSSRVIFRQPWAERPPTIAGRPEVVERRGCDPLAIDSNSLGGKTALRSFIWPDDRGGRRQLDRAMALGEKHAIAIDSEHADTWLERKLEDPAPGTVTVVFHSMLLPSLSPLERDRLEATITGAGGRATADAPVAWLRLESIHGRAEARLTCWPHQRERVVARCGVNGPPVAWVAAA